MSLFLFTLHYGDVKISFRPYPGTQDLKSCFHLSDLMVTKKSFQAWLLIADSRYRPMSTCSLECSQADKSPWTHFCTTAGCFQQAVGKRQKCISQGTGIRSWWKEGNMELDSCDLKREQIVQLNDANLSVNFHWHHWDTVVLESMQLVYLYCDPRTII